MIEAISTIGIFSFIAFIGWIMLWKDNKSSIKDLYDKWHKECIEERDKKTD